MAVAASWLYKATKDPGYLSDAKGFYSSGVPWSFNWDGSMVEASVGTVQNNKLSIFVKIV